MNLEETISQGRDLVAYQESEQSDQKTTDQVIDVLWQNIYDVCALVHSGVLDELLSEDEYLDAVKWLKESQKLTKDYQNKTIEL